MLKRFFMRILDNVIYEIKERKLTGKIVTMVAALLVLGSTIGIKQAVPTSSTVGDRELPIYCVETEEKKIALTFDAAWGNEDTKEIVLPSHQS